ncbi:hypothetical protein [Nocardia abscessus]|uniref:hypothetical protein n=1 Tax=Nocardia abscessus TaxID=120957 RepID=UPI0024588408|nr:hypothetical protein [Nocardia abscessus]
MKQCVHPLGELAARYNKPPGIAFLPMPDAFELQWALTWRSTADSAAIAPWPAPPPTSAQSNCDPAEHPVPERVLRRTPGHPDTPGNEAGRSLLLDRAVSC